MEVINKINKRIVLFPIVFKVEVMLFNYFLYETLLYLQLLKYDEFGKMNPGLP